MLTLAVESIGRTQSGHSSLMTSAMIVAPQVVVALCAPWVGYLSELWGRKPLLLASFAVQIVRAILLVFVSNSILLIAVQTLDGISGAIRTVLMVVILADLTAGTGRFNLASGAVGLVFAIAASISTTMFGFIDQEISRWAAFLSMAAVAAAGGLLVWLLLNETKPSKYDD